MIRLSRSLLMIACTVTVALLFCAGALAKTDATTRPAGGAETRPAPGITLMGIQAETQSVVFLADASGSMIAKIDNLRRRLYRAVKTMKETQSFDLVFMRSPGWVELSPGLIPATAKNADVLFDYFDSVQLGGQTEPIPAVDAAFAKKPDLIFLIADSDFPDNDAVIKRIRSLNAQRKIPIYTISFVEEEDKDTDFKRMLRTIAEENGGKYTEVNGADQIH